jgi:two-component system, cell cycle sensor histidine kinase and response regulator CckA
VSATLEEHRALVDRLPLVTYMVRLEPPTRAVFVSPQIEPVFGFTTEDFETADFWERRMAPEDLPGFLAAFAELRESHGQMSLEYRVTTGEGREVWVRDVGLVNRGDDGELYVHGYLTDVTREKELERDLWRAQRLESVGRLAGGVAQDFNNLLTAIRGYAQLLLARVEPGGVEHHHASEIDHAADRAALLTAQLLAFGRRQVLQARPVELNRLVEDLQGVLSRLVGDDLELVFDLDDGVDPVRIDPAQIEQVLVNLVVNAAEVTPVGGRIVVRTANGGAVTLEDLPPGRYVVLSVEDSGSGIDEAALEHLFEPFFTTKDVGGGVGLGLATAYGIAKQSGGTISVTTAADVGSTFSVHLPEASASAGSTVVIVESDPAMRDVLFEVLSDAGYRAITTATPNAALRVTERLDSPIDLVVTELDEKRAAALASSLGAGGVVTLQKPYSPERLRSAVGAALDVTPSGELDLPLGGSELHVSS